MRKPAGRPPADGGVGSPGAGSNSLPRPLMSQAGVDTMVALDGVGEEAWIEVIQKMDAVYADLVHHQVELEHKNSALEDAQRFIGSVLAAMTDALIVCDRNGRIERVNAAVERMTGRAEVELLGIAVSSLFDATGVLTMERLSDKLRTVGASPAEVEVSLVDRHGNATLLSVNCSARCDHRGVTVGHVLIGRPIGELKRAYESLNVAHRELRQAQQQLVVSEKMAALGRLVAGVAHELNNPISFVFGNMHALKRYGERLKEYLEAIDRGADAASLHKLRGKLKIDRVLSDITPLVEGTLEGAERVSEIVQDLRRFSSTQSEPSESFDVIKVVRTAVSWVIKASKVKPDVVVDMPDTLEITGRKGPVHQIVVNLVQNAVDVMAATAAPRLEISTRQEGRHITVTVRDNGPGIAPGAMQRLFEPFYTTKKIGEGTGLGLYVSYGLAEEMGGTLDAANHPHGGAMFTLRLPLEERAHGA